MIELDDFGPSIERATGQLDADGNREQRQVVVRGDGLERADGAETGAHGGELAQQQGGGYR
ncbi:MULTISPECIES: hypothetical protein [Streptomyces]|uniref:Uncharacterized protein n=1 Tax=Streptomyces lannensis TaxID=766498 RepID=A0ABP7KS26_9ACTN